MNKRIERKLAKKHGQGRLLWIPIDRLVPHPENPRLFIREDIVNTIGAKLLNSGRFNAKYALTVRPIGNGNYEILSGHHRVEASKRAGIKYIPCWSETMTDEEAYDELTLANSQSELISLEYAVHIFKYTDRAKGGRGEEGGLSEYARKHNMSKARVSELCRAGEVYMTVKPSGHPNTFKKKIQHLLVIRNQCPREDWAGLVQMVENRPTMTTADVEGEIAKIKQQVFFNKNEQVIIQKIEDIMVPENTPAENVSEDNQPDDDDGDGYVNHFLQITRAISEARQHIVPGFTDLRSTVCDFDLPKFDNAARAISSDCEDIFETINKAYASIERSENNETVAQIGSY